LKGAALGPEKPGLNRMADVLQILGQTMTVICR